MAQVFGPITAEEALASANKKAASRKRVAAAQKQLGAAGSKNFDGYLFPYAPSTKYPEGHLVIVPTKVKALQELGVTLATMANTFYTNRGGKQARLHRINATKSLGYSFVTRKKPKTKATAAAAAKTSKSEAYLREWHSIAIPASAREIDILKFVATWTKKPEAIKINGEAILLKTPKSAAYQGLKKKSAKAASTTAKLDIG